MNSAEFDMKYQEINKSVHYIIERLQHNGFAGSIAGGAVRDILLGKNPNDFDILTNASLDEIETVFFDQKTKIVGKTFSICIVNGIEVSSTRVSSDKPYSNEPECHELECHEPDCNKSDCHSLCFYDLDLAGRDFTVNAMAYDPALKQIIDPFKGREDLKDKIIRFTVNPEKRIEEDPVRLVRACRIAAKISGRIEQISFDAIVIAKNLLDSSVAKERIGHEIIKAMALEKPSLFFKALKETGLLLKIFPSLDRCYDLDGGPYHGETVFEHCMMTGDAISPKYPVLRLAAFLHDAGKFDAAILKHGRFKSPYLSFPGHEKETKAIICDLENLKFSTRDIVYIKALVNAHMRPLSHETTPKSVRKLLAMLEGYTLDYKDFMRMRIADKGANLLKEPYTMAEIKIRLLKLFAQIFNNAPSRQNQLNITGGDIIKILQLKESPEIGRIKQILFEKILDNPELNNYEDLEKICLSLRIKK